MTHTKIRSKLVVIVTTGSQKITLWGPQRTPLGILRVNAVVQCYSDWFAQALHESKLVITVLSCCVKFFTVVRIMKLDKFLSARILVSGFLEYTIVLMV